MPRRYARSLAALAAGALLPLALAPFAVWPLLLVSAGALFWVLRGTETGKRAFWRGWLYGVGKYGAGASWVYVSIHVYGETAPWLALLLVTVFVGGMALFNGLFGWVFHRLARRQASETGAAFTFGVLWTSLEWLLTWFLTGFPWLFAGYAFVDTPLAGLAPVGGVLLVSFAAVLTASLAVAAVGDGLVPSRGLGPSGASESAPPHAGDRASWRTRWGRPERVFSRLRWGVVAVLVSIWIAAWALGSVTWTERGETRTVALAQGNIPQTTKWTPEGVAQSRRTYRELTASAGDVDIVVWPEAAIPDYLRRTKRYIEAQRRGSTDIITGILVAEAREGTDVVDYYNAAIATGDDAVYRKRHLVPFGDHVPFESVLRGLISFFDLPMSATTAGETEQPLLRAAEIDLAMAICWEIAYPATVAADGRQAQVLVTISNDTWFGESIGPSQHFQIARMRAKENGKYLLRATNDGITAIVDDNGDVVERLPRFESGVLTGTFHAVSGTTPYSRWLHQPLWIVLGVCAIVGLGHTLIRSYSKLGRNRSV
ncbi:MAG: apolipoprotein N-acyltransferase [Gammaproteobacteria bacterium]|nr:apolipoprotein N-acyltransferase [Gammaproteobacteria bacterium]MYF27325.1 apolipoprotein N-acyltransferase [Gammaproteobacteria bacterium]MYK47954.1 apolipoprotein N-acyltransferase [Gammaproteobacteria bacterium]